MSDLDTLKVGIVACVSVSIFLGSWDRFPGYMIGWVLGGWLFRWLT